MPPNMIQDVWGWCVRSDAWDVWTGGREVLRGCHCFALVEAALGRGSWCLHVTLLQLVLAVWQQTEKPKYQYIWEFLQETELWESKITDLHPLWLIFKSGTSANNNVLLLAGANSPELSPSGPHLQLLGQFRQLLWLLLLSICSVSPAQQRLCSTAYGLIWPGAVFSKSGRKLQACVAMVLRWCRWCRPGASALPSGWAVADEDGIVQWSTVPASCRLLS